MGRLGRSFSFPLRNRTGLKCNEILNPSLPITQPRHCTSKRAPFCFGSPLDRRHFRFTRSRAYGPQTFIRHINPRTSLDECSRS
jgi:hypothetical protein